MTDGNMSIDTLTLSTETTLDLTRLKIRIQAVAIFIL